MSASRRVLHATLGATLVLGIAAPSRVETAEPTIYRFTFPEAAHHWMQVEATFSELTSAPLELRMSRSSPGRYSLHDFAKNVYDVQAAGPDGKPLVLSRPDPYGWTLPAHGAQVTVRYKVFGDRVDGTYLGIDTTHAHLNMPASVMWARGRDDRPATLRFEPPAGSGWQVATQLYSTANLLEYTAPNLQYLMDSPTEIGPVAIRQFEVDGHTFRFSAHHTGTNEELDGYVADVQKIVRAEREIYGEFPSYEPGTYTFLAEYLPYASGDGMEHRNSTVITSSASIASGRRGLLNTVAHEFFHNWNVERIRPRSIEPFNFEGANISGELWLAEGFTQYYAPLALSRAGLADVSTTAGTLGGLVQAIAAAPGRDVRSPVEMSQMAAFTDGGRTVDRTNWANTFISYYPYGGAVALALDLSLRERSDSRVSLDDFMRAMWRVHGKPGGARPGYVDHPYTLEDAEQRLAEVSDAAFAHDFFTRYVHGRELPDYGRLLAAAGFDWRLEQPGRAWWGDFRVEQSSGLKIVVAPLANTPAYAAGLDLDDVVVEVDGTRVSSAPDLQSTIGRHRPGDALAVVYTDRAGRRRTTTVKLAENPEREIIPVESRGGTLSEGQRRFRRAWLGI